MKKKNEISIVCSSADEYLTFLTETGQIDVNAIYADENVWLSQKMMGLTWSKQFEGVLRLLLKEILTNAEKISVEIGKQHVKAEFEKYRVKQDRLFESGFGRFTQELDGAKGGGKE